MEKVINQPVTLESEDQEPIIYGPSPFQSGPQQEEVPPIFDPMKKEEVDMTPQTLYSDPTESVYSTLSNQSSQSSELPQLSELYQPYKPQSSRSKDPNRYKGHSLMRRIIEAEEEERAILMASSNSLSEKDSLASEQSGMGISSIGMNYKDVWMKNNMATVVANIHTGQLLKGNTAFMQ